MNSNFVEHTIDPVYDSNSKILILGSFPSVKSREVQFFYGHPQNRFWRVLSSIFNVDLPQNNDEKRELLINNRVAVWDVIKSCEIVGSSDSSIKNAVPNDLSSIINISEIDTIFVNGKLAEKLYIKYIENQTGIKAICLPSTSPANASWSFERLYDKWNNEIRKALD